MKTFKTHQIVLLPTNEEKGDFTKERVYPCILGYGKAFGEKGKLVYSDSNIKTPTILNHLYILSDEKPSIGDWVICSNWEKSYQKLGQVSHIGEPFNFKNTIQINGNPDLHIDRHVLDYCKKVIATTDKELTISTYDSSDELSTPGSMKLPQIPQEFIEQYIRKYNDSGKGIDYVEVEYIKQRCTEPFSKNGCHCIKDEECSRPIRNLLINSGNTINIKPIEEKMYSREEVEQIVWEMHHKVFLFEATYEGTEKFIEQNL